MNRGFFEWNYPPYGGPFPVSHYGYNWAYAESYVPVASKLQNAICNGQSSGDSAELWSALPDDVLECILSLLPVVYILRARAVCRRWNAVALSRRFLTLVSQIPCKKPWYFMFWGIEGDSSGLAYDPHSDDWHGFDIPGIDSYDWSASSASGLTCFMKNQTLRVCNPLARAWRELPMPENHQQWRYNCCTVSLAADAETGAQTIVVACSVQFPKDYNRWRLFTDVYDSKTNSWAGHGETVLQGWHGGAESVICGGVFYCVTYATSLVVGGNNNCRHGLIAYCLSAGSFAQVSAPMPCSFTCVRLINCKERLIMVGGIGSSEHIKGIGIWELVGTGWEEITRMPSNYFRRFGEFHEVFSSSGSGDLIYIHSFGSPLLMFYDLLERTWYRPQKPPLVSKRNLFIFTGFCFEPRLDASAQGQEVGYAKPSLQM